MFLSRISAEAFQGLGLAVVAMGIMAFQFRALPVAVVQANDEKGDAKRGQEVFYKRCAGCHSLDEDKEGPRLRGVYGRTAARITTFKYSDALKASGVTWDAASLEQWMADPEKIVPNSDMFFRVPKASERTDVVAYLQTLSYQ